MPQPPDELKLESGKTLGPVTLAYETYGRLNAEKSNAILVCTPFPATPMPPVSTKGKRTPGGGSDMIGPGKAFDTDRYFVICSNVIGGLQGEHGALVHQPEDGEALRPRISPSSRSPTWSRPSGI